MNALDLAALWDFSDPAASERRFREADAAGQPDPHVFEELEAPHRARGDAERAEHYAGRREALPR